MAAGGAERREGAKGEGSQAPSQPPGGIGGARGSDELENFDGSGAAREEDTLRSQKQARMSTQAELGNGGARASSYFRVQLLL